MKAILTRYLGATERRPSRIVASEPDGKRLVVAYDSSLNPEEMHRKAAEMFRDKLGWSGKLAGGCLKVGMAWVLLPERAR